MCETTWHVTKSVPQWTSLHTLMIYIQILSAFFSPSCPVCVFLWNLSPCQRALISIIESRVLRVCRGGKKREDKWGRALLCFHAAHTSWVPTPTFCPCAVQFQPLLSGLIMAAVIADCESHVIKLIVFCYDWVAHVKVDVKFKRNAHCRLSKRMCS